MTGDVEAVFTLRRRYWTNGYRPIEVWSPDQRVNDNGEPLNSPGKQPRGRWREAAAEDPPAAVRHRPDPRALNTGLACVEIVGFDVDILDPGLADQVVHKIEMAIGRTPLLRIGRIPKILLVHRANKVFRKIQTPELFLPDGQKVKVEVLAEGQQFVADGIHPDTGQPYRWTDESPETVHVSLLPIVTEQQVRQVIGQIEHLLREAGATRGAKSEEQLPRAAHYGTGSSFFNLTNEASLADIAAWVRSLFPRARFEPGTQAWRVSSKDLGRALEEDLSVHPGGIQDFGEEITLTPIDLVMRHADLGSAIEAALWLCDRLAIDPATLGYQPPRNAQIKGNAPDDAPGALGVSLDDFYAYMPLHAYIYSPARDVWPAASVNARIPPILAAVDHRSEPKTIKANTWLDKNKPVEQMTWAPGLPMIIKNRLISEGGWIERDYVSCFNLYRPPSIELGDPAKAGRWLEHVNKVYPDDAEHIIRWLAHRRQRPQDKINHALVLGGKQGIGKDSMLEPVKRAVGPWNFSEVSPQQAIGRFNGFLKSVILRISEARDLGDTDRFKFYDHMKAVTAAPPDVLRVDEKNLREHSILNCCGVIITTNHKTDGIYLPADDRRHYVTWSDLDKEDFEASYWDDLWRWYEKGGCEHAAAYLAELDLSDFDAKATPPKTQAFWEIVDASRPSCRRAFHAAAQRWVLDAIAAGALALADIRSGPPSTRPLLQMQQIPPPVLDQSSGLRHRRCTFLRTCSGLTGLSPKLAEVLPDELQQFRS
jgi:Family of unknown function (DUF5906)/Bifunctional DNA primase/polymerase, N-terminal